MQTIATTSALIAICTLVFAAQAQGQSPTGLGGTPDVRIETFDLGTMVAGRDTFPRAINNRGEIVGMALRSDGVPMAFLWSARSGFMSIMDNATAFDINDAGEVVGRWYSCPIGPCPQGGGFIWSEGKGFRNLGSFVPLAISKGGNMAGQCETGTGADDQACVSIDEIVTRVPFPDLPLSSSAVGINNRGDIVGTALVRAPLFSVTFRGFLFTREGELIDEFPGTNSHATYAQAINKSGTIAGAIAIAGSWFATIWTHRGLTVADLPSYPYAINNRDEVVGSVPDGVQNQPMFWTEGLGVVALGPSYGQNIARDINDRGYIVGPMRDDDSGNYHVTVWRVRRVVNHDVSFVAVESTFRTSVDNTGCPAGFTGTFSFTGSLKSAGSPPLIDLQLQAHTLTNDNLLLNADAGPANVGATLTVPQTGAYADGVLGPNEAVDVPLVIYLKDRSPFQFFVDVLGVHAASQP